jgi:hypothetical protein
MWRAKTEFASLQSPREMQTLQTSERAGNGLIEKPLYGQYRAKGIDNDPFGCSVSLREAEQPNREPAPETGHVETPIYGQWRGKMRQGGPSGLRYILPEEPAEGRHGR